MSSNSLGILAFESRIALFCSVLNGFMIMGSNAFISHLQNGQLALIPFLSCHAFRQLEQIKWPHGSNLRSLLFSEHILHNWNDVPMSKYMSYCSLDIVMRSAAEMAIWPLISICTTRPSGYKYLELKFKDQTVKRPESTCVYLQSLFFTVNKSLYERLWNCLKNFFISSNITDRPLAKFCAWQAKQIAWMDNFRFKFLRFWLRRRKNLKQNSPSRLINMLLKSFENLVVSHKRPKINIEIVIKRWYQKQKSWNQVQHYNTKPFFFLIGQTRGAYPYPGCVNAKNFQLFNKVFHGWYKRVKTSNSKIETYRVPVSCRWVRSSLASSSPSIGWTRLSFMWNSFHGAITLQKINLVFDLFFLKLWWTTSQNN